MERAINQVCVKPNPDETERNISKKQDRKVQQEDRGESTKSKTQHVYISDFAPSPVSKQHRRGNETISTPGAKSIRVTRIITKKAKHNIWPQGIIVRRLVYYLRIQLPVNDG